jgi:hypothetical protein
MSAFTAAKGAAMKLGRMHIIPFRLKTITNIPPIKGPFAGGSLLLLKRNEKLHSSSW